MKEVPTAESFLRNQVGLRGDEGMLKIEQVAYLMTTYGKLCAQAALEAAAENAKAVIINDGYPPDFKKETPKKASVIKDSILNAYPLNLIK